MTIQKRMMICWTLKPPQILMGVNIHLLEMQYMVIISRKIELTLVQNILQVSQSLISTAKLIKLLLRVIILLYMESFREQKTSCLIS